ncbi:MAG: glycosyltransferase family 4 protein [Cyanobacteria bacterium J06649_4]
MNVLHLSTSDIEGGAARAAYRLHQGLTEAGVSSNMLVRAKQSSDEKVLAERSLLTKLGPPLNTRPLRRYRDREPSMFSPQWFPDVIASKICQLNPDIVHLHWVCNGFMKIETLEKLGKPIVWTLHDMWPMTGGCHYAQTCDRYTQSCGSCPQLHSQDPRDLSYKIWQRKLAAWKDLDMTLIAPSHWFAELAQASSLFKNKRIEVIPHGLNLNQYRPISPPLARTVMNLPSNKKILLFGASSGVTNDPRKGFQFLRSALQSLSQTDWHQQLEVVIFGISEPSEPLDLGFPVHYTGRLQDDMSLMLAYAAADVMVVPSMQESFGQTASESLACGTPVVAFNATGLKDIISHKQDGYLAAPYKVDDLERGIVWVLENSERHTRLCQRSRENAEQHLSLELQAKRHQALYQTLTSA